MPHNNMPHNTDHSVNSGWFLCVKNNTGGGWGYVKPTLFKWHPPP